MAILYVFAFFGYEKIIFYLHHLLSSTALFWCAKYVADSPTAPFTKWLDHVEDIEFMHNGLKDLYVCYSVIAVDWVGNKSVMSETSCGENCPVLYMPNVFTPDASVEYNDTFHAFSATSDILNNECSRFIDFMSFTIINRWGEEVFVVSSDDVSAVVWDGRDKSGDEMATAFTIMWLMFS